MRVRMKYKPISTRSYIGTTKNYYSKLPVIYNEITVKEFPGILEQLFGKKSQERKFWKTESVLSQWCCVDTGKFVSAVVEKQLDECFRV